MFHQQRYDGTREQNYESVIRQLQSLLDGEPDPIANLANAAALLKQFMDDINWVGFYLHRDGMLVLGPFQGLPACVRIPLGKGVCGKAALERTTVRVADVHEFPGHIACDAASLSEIVVPVVVRGELYGVLDIDSPIRSRFDETDQHNLERFVAKLGEYL
ncbi:GAF domain-containing protein [Paenibacillus sp. GYB003]|uniref:GAF domain-containing protein n=1 Tax=Paenibacillus sp. GYB003 TaxID=2994392 RepID=UPI002F962FD8